MSTALALEADNPFQNTALITWPVRFDRDNKTSIANPHVTAVFIADTTGHTPERVLEVLRLEPIAELNTHRIVNVNGVDAFGPNGEYPVLLIDKENLQSTGVAWTQKHIKRLFEAEGIAYDNTWSEFKPHVTCDIRTVVNPPSRVILKPLELWWHGDTKYVV